MKYQVGDEIIVVHSQDEGKVVEIINDKMVLIEIKGVRFPAYMDQIDFPYFKRFSQNKIVPSKERNKVYVDQLPSEKRRNEVKVSDGIWLALFPKFEMDIFGDEVVEKIKVYLINRTDKAYEFTYKLNYPGKTDFEITSDVLAFKDFYLNDVPFENFNDNPSFDFDFRLLEPDNRKADFYEAAFKIKPKQIFQKIEELKEKNLPSINHRLMDTFPDRVVTDNTFNSPLLDLSKLTSAGYKVYDAGKARQYLEPARSVIDLHIEKIIDDWKGLSSFEILTIQLREFEKWYDLAVANRLPNFFVIHGVGKGKLKEDIHELLKARTEVKYFVNQYEPRFGYGATEIVFQY